MDELLAADVRHAIEVELATIEAHCYVLNDPDDDDDPKELAACIKLCAQRVRDLLDGGADDIAAIPATPSRDG